MHPFRCQNGGYCRRADLAAHLSIKDKQGQKLKVFLRVYVVAPALNWNVTTTQILVLLINRSHVLYRHENQFLVTPLVSKMSLGQNRKSAGDQIAFWLVLHVERANSSCHLLQQSGDHIISRRSVYILCASFSMVNLIISSGIVLKSPLFWIWVAQWSDSGFPPDAQN